MTKEDFGRDLGQFRATTYMVIGLEVGEQGTQHLQGYVCFAARTDFDMLHNWNERVHWEEKRGTVRQAADYCKKDGDYWEDGEIPEEQGANGAAVRKQQFIDAFLLAKENKVEEVDPEIQLKYLGSLNKIADRELKQPNQLEGTCGIWVHGPPGSGKTRWVHDEYGSIDGTLYLKLANKWWDHYKGEPNVLLDDIDPSHCKYLTHHLKQWMDRYRFKAEYKGGARNLRPESFIVTSNYSIDECFEDPRDREAIRRRCDVVEFVPVAGGFRRLYNGE